MTLAGTTGIASCAFIDGDIARATDSARLHLIFFIIYPGALLCVVDDQ